MAGLGIGLYTDEDVFRALARVLRDRGYDAQSCQEAGRAGQGVPDDAQLAYASQHGRAMLTFNSTDFLRLDVDWKRASREHAGIIVSAEVADLGELLRRVERHLNTYPPSVQHNTLLWLDSSATR